MLRQRAFVAGGRVVRYAGGGLAARSVEARDNARVVVTHEVPSHDLGRFAAIVRYLAGERRVVTPREFLDYYGADGGRVPIEGRTLLFTFDDGLRSSYRAAKLVLEPLGVKAAFFVPTGILELESEDEMRRFVWERVHWRSCPLEELTPDRYLTMTRDELIDLVRSGHAVFPHTHSHALISGLAAEADVEAELRRPRRILEELLQTSCDAFAFPLGNERAATPAALEEVAHVYRFCFWALSGPNTDTTNPLLLHRDAVHPWHSLAHVRTIAGGSYDAYHGLRLRRFAQRLDLPSRDGAGPAPHPERRRFVEAVGRELEAAHVEHVFLHDYEADGGVDSDVDVAVGRGGVAAVDALLRTGRLGRVLQRLDYADPWCRYYVLAAAEPGRRCREVDVACDPWGIGKDGPALRVALAGAVDGGGIRVPAPAAETLYLAIKKARKRQTGERTRALLQRAFARDPDGSRRLLEQHLGQAGRALADALTSAQPSLGHELEAVRRRLRRRWLRPQLLARRVAFAAARALRRVLRPTGLVVGIVGPDGVGKSTLAAELEQATGARFRRSRRHHLRPGVLPAPARLLRRTPSHGEQPHARPPSGPAGALLRVLYLALDTLLGWVPLVAVPRARSTLVVLERGWLDLLVDPLRYRLDPSSLRAVRLLARILPRPSLVLLLDARSEVVAARKPELAPDEVARQLDAWRRLAAADPARFRTIDASLPPDRVLAEALAAVDDRLAARQLDLSRCEVALSCLGRPDANGSPYRIVSATRRPVERGPRWLLPRRRGAPGPRALRLFQPARPRHALPAAGLELVQRAGLPWVGTSLPVSLDAGAGAAVAEALGLPEVELAAAVTGDPGRGVRALLSVSHRGRLVALAKVAREDARKLGHERRVLDLLAACPPGTLVVPAVAGLVEWGGCTILLLEPFRLRRRVDREPGAVELDALAQLVGLGDALAPELGAEPGRVPVHGDFTPWNCAAAGRRLVLWDWEEARLGLPLEDLFHWRLLRLMRFGGEVDGLVAAAVRPADDVRALCERLSLPTERAPAALRACLDRTLAVRRRTTHLGPEWAAAVPMLERAVDGLARAVGEP